MADRFVTETEIEEAKRKRQEEWDRVRQADDPKSAPEAPVENRSLFDRLKEQKDRKDLDDREAKAFKNMVRGLDSDETAFLDLVDEVKAKEGRKLASEEAELLAEVREAQGSAVEADAKAALAPPKPSARAPKRQSSLLAGAVRAKAGRAEEEVAARPSATATLGRLPGLASYASSSDSANDSDSSSDSAPEPTQTYPLNLPENQPAAQAQAQQQAAAKKPSAQHSCS